MIVSCKFAYSFKASAEGFFRAWSMLWSTLFLLSSTNSLLELLWNHTLEMLTRAAKQQDGNLQYFRNLQFALQVLKRIKRGWRIKSLISCYTLGKNYPLSLPCDCHGDNSVLFFVLCGNSVLKHSRELFLDWDHDAGGAYSWHEISPIDLLTPCGKPPMQWVLALAASSGPCSLLQAISDLQKDTGGRQEILFCSSLGPYRKLVLLPVPMMIT